MQTARPSSDISIGPWTDDGAGTTDLYLAVSDSSDLTWIEDLNGGNGTVEFAIDSMDDPVGNVDHVISGRFRSAGGGGPERLNVQLWQGTSFQIATTGNLTNRDANFGLFGVDIGDVAADSITDYGALRIRVISSNLGGTEDMFVADVWFEAPDAPAGGARRIFNM